MTTAALYLTSSAKREPQSMIPVSLGFIKILPYLRHNHNIKETNKSSLLNINMYILPGEEELHFTSKHAKKTNFLFCDLVRKRKVMQTLREQPRNVVKGKSGRQLSDNPTLFACGIITHRDKVLMFGRYLDMCIFLMVPEFHDDLCR